MKAWDPASDRAREAQRRHDGNSIGIALLGPILGILPAAARATGAPESVVENAARINLDIGLTVAGMPARGSVSLRVAGEVHPAVTGVLSMQKQTRHTEGGKGYDGGGYFKDQHGLTAAEQAELVLHAYKSGAAEVMGFHKGEAIVKWNEVTGYNNNQRMGFHSQPTNLFWIKGTNSVSVVPYNPSYQPH
jgi:hypothetical protein